MAQSENLVLFCPVDDELAIRRARRVQEMERAHSSRFTIVEVEQTAKPFAAMNRIIG